MKDPLQTVDSPYELLKVEPGADRKTIDKAFMVALQKKVASPAAIKLARDTLLDPIARLDHELLQYHPRVFEQLTPSPLADPTVLDTAKRASTATSWQRHLKKNCSDIWVAHALAVLWYWWTLHEEESFVRTLHGDQHVDFTSGAKICDRPLSRLAQNRLDALHQKWRSLIGYWSIVASTPRFWSTLPDVSASQVSILQEKFTARVKDRLRELSQRYSTSAYSSADGAAGCLAEHYRSLEHALTTELATAREVGSAGILKIGGHVCYAGPILLKQMSILEKVQEAVKEKLDRLPTNKQLRELRRLLSPYRSLETLIDENKPQAALDAMAKLSDEERHTSEVAQLRSRAYHLLGKQKAELGSTEEALTSWKQARRYEHKKSVDEQIIEDVVSTCLAESSKLEGKQIDKAIAVLEQGLKIVKEDEKLKAALANLLTRRGLQAINDIQKEVGPDASTILRRMEDIKAAFNRGLVDLDRAAALGSKDAARLAGEARDAIRGLEANQYYNRGVGTINEALEKAQREKKGFTAEIKASVQQGLRDLEKAQTLGHPQAAEQVGMVRNLLAQADNPMLGGAMGGQVPGWVQKANDAAEAAKVGSWDRAITLLQQAIQEGGKDAPADLKKSLSVCYTNRGIQRANRAAEEMQRGSGGGIPDFMMQKLRSNRYSDDCAICGKSKHTAYGETWCTITLPEGGTPSLCSGCAELLQIYMSTATGPSASVLTGLRNAESDLKEAVNLDPSNSHARQNLTELLGLLAKLPRSSPPASTATTGSRWKPSSGTAPKSPGTAGVIILLLLADAAVGAVIAAICGGIMHSSAPDTYKTFGDAFGKVFGGYMMLSFIFFCNGGGNILVLVVTIVAAIRKWLKDITRPPRYY